MKRTILVAIAAAWAASWAAQVSAQTPPPILQFGEPVIAVDIIANSRSSYPAGENPPKAIDGVIPPMGSTTGNKYLNFARFNTGIMVTPAAPTTVTGIQVATANDGIGFREPESFSLWGTNDVINHASVTMGGSDNGSSLEYNWTLISEGPFTNIPTTTNTLYDPITFANATPWSSYRVVFPTIGATGDSGCCMQVAEVRLLDAANNNVLAPTNGVSAFQIPQPFSDSPDAEEAINLTDLDPMTKYLNFGKEGSGFIVTPQVGPRIITGFEITTANDAEGRDPASWQLYGTNDPIVSGQHSTTNPENWVLVDEGTLALPSMRMTLGPLVPVDGGSTAYSSYRMVFPTLKDTFGAGVDSMQIAEVQLYGVPEPGTLAIVLAALVAGCGACRRR